MLSILKNLKLSKQADVKNVLLVLRVSNDAKQFNEDAFINTPDKSIIVGFYDENNDQVLFLVFILLLYYIYIIEK